MHFDTNARWQVPDPIGVSAPLARSAPFWLLVALQMNNNHLQVDRQLPNAI